MCVCVCTHVGCLCALCLCGYTDGCGCVSCVCVQLGSAGAPLYVVVWDRTSPSCSTRTQSPWWGFRGDGPGAVDSIQGRAACRGVGALSQCGICRCAPDAAGGAATHHMAQGPCRQHASNLAHLVTLLWKRSSSLSLCKRSSTNFRQSRCADLSGPEEEVQTKVNQRACQALGLTGRVWRKTKPQAVNIVHVNITSRVFTNPVKSRRLVRTSGRWEEHTGW